MGAFFTISVSQCCATIWYVFWIAVPYCLFHCIHRDKYSGGHLKYQFPSCRKYSSSATDQCYIIYSAVAAAAPAAASLAPGTFVSPNVPNLREILHPRHLSCSINLSQHATRGRTEQTELIRQNRSKTTLENIHVIIRRG